MSQDNQSPDEEVQKTYEGDIQDDPRYVFSQELEVAGGKALETLKQIIKEGNVRRVIIRSAEDKVLLDTPLTVGMGVGGMLAIMGWLPLMLITAGVAALAKVKVQVVREVRDGGTVKGNQVDVPVEDEDHEAQDEDEA